MSAGAAPERACGECSLCCTVLRVPELRKLGGVTCEHVRPGGGCGIHAERPPICRAYRCLWLQGGFEESDRPDRLGAVVDVLAVGPSARLSIQEAEPDAYDRSPRLQAIAAQYRESMPVRIVEHGGWLDANRPFRVLEPGGGELRVRGEIIERYRDGAKLGEQRMPWLDRQLRRVAVAWRRWRIR